MTGDRFHHRLAFLALPFSPCLFCTDPDARVEFLSRLLHVATIATGLFMVGGTALSLSRRPHWFIRGWDFPRPLIAGISAVSGLAYVLVWYDGHLWQVGLMAMIAVTILWQLYRIAPYLPFARRAVDWARHPRRETSVRIVASNVMQENDQHQAWLDIVRAADPDVILALETDARWTDALSEMRDAYPHVVSHPQDNYYGLTVFSRLPLVEPEVRSLVEEDVPSVRTGVELRNGTVIHLYGVHPRPPEPIRDNHAEERDAEVVLLGREIQDRSEDAPVIVAGDFNDVAWSHTTDLFVQLSGLLDPRQGRGIFNTFHAKWPVFRFPLDHVFHSNHFKLVDIGLLDNAGSDHFPVCVELQYDWSAPEEQPEPEPSAEDVQEAEEKVQRAEE